MTFFLYLEQQTKQGPLLAATKMVPVPETLMSPDCPPTNAPTVQHKTNIHSNTSTPNNKVAAIKSNKGNIKTVSFILCNILTNENRLQ